jgi:predicted permease
MEFQIYFLPIFKAVFVIFTIGLVSGVLLRKGVLLPVHIESLSHITVVLLLPALTFSKIIQYFKPEEFVYWWLLPLSGVVMIGVGVLITSLFYIRQIKNKRSFIAISAFMNANYMVLPIGQFVFPNQFDLFATYTFMFVLGVMPMLWSVGKFMVTSSAETKFSPKTLLTPPLLANILALFFVLTGVNKFIPNIIITPIDFIGRAAIPAVTIVLGATIGGIVLKQTPPLIDIVKVMSTKLFILPIVVIFVLLKLDLVSKYPLIADMLVIQSSVAPATQIIIQVKKYGGDVQKIGSMMFIAYVLCLFTIPLWFSVWNMLK